MKKLIYLTTVVLCASTLYAQPNFTYADMPNIGDNDSLDHNPNYTHSGDLDSETGNNFTWDFTSLSFGGIFWAVDSFRVKTHPASAPYTDADIEHYHREASGDNLNLYSFSNDTLFLHRTGPTTGGSAFLPPVASIHFPIAFNQTSLIIEPLLIGSTQIGERSTETYYDGFGTLNLPNGGSYNNVFRIRSTVIDSTFSTGFTVKYTNYLWYIQGGDIPLLRLFKIDFNGSAGTIYNVYLRKNAPTVSNGEISGSDDVRLYPNPTQDYLQLSGLSHRETYTILDISGRQIKHGSISDGERIRVQELPVGTYFLKIGDEKVIEFVRN